MHYQEAIQCACAAAAHSISLPTQPTSYWSQPANIINVLGAIGSFGAAIAAFIAVFYTGYQVRQSRRALGVQLLLSLEDKFDSAECKKSRIKAATVLQDGENMSEMHDMLMFFEKVGLLVHEGALEAELVWNIFYFWIRPFSALSCEFIKIQRLNDSDATYWTEFEYLINRLDKVEIEKRKLDKLAPVSDKEKGDFFALELPPSA